MEDIGTKLDNLKKYISEGCDAPRVVAGSRGQCG